MNQISGKKREEEKGSQFPTKTTRFSREGGRRAEGAGGRLRLSASPKRSGAAGGLEGGEERGREREKTRLHDFY